MSLSRLKLKFVFAGLALTYKINSWYGLIRCGHSCFGGWLNIKSNHTWLFSLSITIIILIIINNQMTDTEAFVVCSPNKCCVGRGHGPRHVWGACYTWAEYVIIQSMSLVIPLQSCTKSGETLRIFQCLWSIMPWQIRTSYVTHLLGALLHLQGVTDLCNSKEKTLTVNLSTEMQSQIIYNNLTSMVYLPSLLVLCTYQTILSRLYVQIICPVFLIIYLASLSV